MPSVNNQYVPRKTVVIMGETYSQVISNVWQRLYNIASTINVLMFVITISFQ